MQPGTAPGPLNRPGTVPSPWPAACSPPAPVESSESPARPAGESVKSWDHLVPNPVGDLGLGAVAHLVVGPRAQQRHSVGLATELSFVAGDLVDDRFVRKAIEAVGGTAAFGLPENWTRQEVVQA